jgi:hypothetical protein
MPNIDPPPREPAQPPGSAGFLQVLGAVFSSFLGIRKKASGERDTGTIKPQHVIVAGILCAALFVLVLVVLVRFITRA